MSALTCAAVAFYNNVRTGIGMGLRHTYHPDIDQHSNNNRNNNNNSNSNVVIPRYADQRPISPMGFICVHGAKGRLNNLIIQNLVGMHMAFYLNRTLLVDNTVAKYFDIDKLGLESWPLDEYPYKPAIQIHNISCPNSDPHVPLQETLFSRYIRQFTTKRKIFSCLEFTIIRFGIGSVGRQRIFTPASSVALYLFRVSWQRLMTM